MMNLQKKKCDGTCVSINMQNLPNDWHWNTPSGAHPWYSSHGSPTVRPGAIGMWST